MTDISRLIEKLEAATEGSIGLDVEVLHACGFGNSDEYPVREGPTWLTPTRSLEDALALIGKVATGWEGEVTFLPSGRGYTDMRGPEYCDADMYQWVSSPITALALSASIALCKSLEKMEKVQK